MNAVFTKTAKSSANESFIHAAIAAIVGITFIVASILASNVQTWLTVLLISIGGLCLVFANKLRRSGTDFLTSGLDWRVEVTDSRLSWQSPLQKVMPSFELPLSSIKTLRHIRIRRGGKQAGYRNEFSIVLIDDDPIHLSENLAGIDPNRVFEALEARGVPIEREAYLTKREVKEKNRKDWDQKRIEKAKQRSETPNRSAQ